MTNVKSYTTNQLIARCKAIKGFKTIPSNYWGIFVRSTEDGNNIFDDKFYLFKGEENISVTSCTTNKGNDGTAVMKSDQWCYETHEFGLHKGKMRALRQVKSVDYFRDKNENGKTDETGTIYNDIIYMNIHGSTYNKGSNQVTTKIGGWSHGCLVLNDNDYYEDFIDKVEPQKKFSYCLLKEF
jgi:hypothetical protein